MNQSNINMKKLKKRSIFLLLTIVLSLGISLAAVYYVYAFRDSRENKLATEMVTIDFKETSNVINLSSNVPVIDDVGLDSTPYEFSVTNTSKVPINAKIMLDVDNTSTIKYGAVRYALFINNERVIKDYIHKDNLILYTYHNLGVGEDFDCKLYMWVDYYYDSPGETFKAKVKVEGESIDTIHK